MATIKPFAALRPTPELAARVCELPYDVMSSAEARELARGNPLSFLRVSKPEIDLPLETDPYAPEVYATGAKNFAWLAAQGALRPDPRPGFYLYRQVMGSHAQTGVVAVASCDEYIHGTIKKHELTRVDKEDDRVRHIEALNSQTGPAFLTYRAAAAVDQFVARRTAEPPGVDFTAPDGVRHSSWTVADSEGVEFLRQQFQAVPFLYIADGHHRSAAAARVSRARHGAGESNWFLTVIFPHNQMRILPYNRVLRDLNSLTPASFLTKLEQVFTITPATQPQPTALHSLGLYLLGRWHHLQFKARLTEATDLVGGLDVSLLQRHVLGPILGVADPRTSKRLNFVGGIRGTDELERLVSGGEYACAFTLFPTRIEDLMAIADAGGIMPPKSTWFEPKLRDGMFCHNL